MGQKNCKKCGHLCHCVADHKECGCKECGCGSRELEQEEAEQATYENNGGLVIDDTGECESCQ